MAFENLPIVSTKIVDAGIPQPEILTRPIALAFGWLEDDYFATDKRPIFFNTPYYVPDTEDASSALPLGGEAFDYAVLIASGANKSDPNANVVPVIVRIGYPDYKVEIDDTIGGSGSSTDASGELTITYDVNNDSNDEDIAKLSWTSHSWDANMTVDIVRNSDGTVSVYYNYDGNTGWPEPNAQNLNITEDTEIELSYAGAKLLLYAGGVTAADAGIIGRFKLTARRAPTNNEEKYKAVIDGMKEIEGLEAYVVTVAGVNLDDEIEANTMSVWVGDPDYADDLSQVKLNFGYALARFAYKVSNSYHMCFGVIGVKKPSQVTPAGLKAWADYLNDLEGWKDGFYATTTGRLGDTPIQDDEGAPIDIGKHLVVVAFHGKVTGFNNIDNLGPYIGAWLAARPTGAPGNFMNISFSPDELGISSYDNYLVYLVNYNVLDKIYAARINVPKPIVATDGSLTAFQIPIARTGAMASSTFTKLSTCKIATTLMQDLRDRAETFLGRPLSGLTLEVLRSNLQDIVNGYAAAGYIAAGTVSVEPGEIGTVLGEVKVRVAVSMYAEITTIVITGVFSLAGV